MYREDLVHLYDDSNLLPDSILKIRLIWATYMHSAQQKVFLQGVIYFYIILIKLGVRSDLDLLYSSLFLVNKLFKMFVLDELIKKKLKSSAIYDFVFFLHVKGTLPSLIALFGVYSHGVRLLQLWLISNRCFTRFS